MTLSTWRGSRPSSVQQSASHTLRHKTLREFTTIWSKPTWKLNPVIDVWRLNERPNHWGWQADFYIALMDLHEADGYRLGLWSQSAGIRLEDARPEIARRAVVLKNTAITFCVCMNTALMAC
ncbi:MAG: hypothetical protein U0559_16345 [Anaerolineae bacterium]